MAFKLASSAFDEGTAIPKKFTCDGADVMPALSWSGAPSGVKSYAIIMDDPDAPPGTWVHWTIHNLPESVTRLEENLEKTAALKNGAKQGQVWGVEEFDRVGYHGPCPPPGTPHRYYFKLYALDTLLELPANYTKFDLEKAMKGHVLGEAQLMGRYGR